MQEKTTTSQTGSKNRFFVDIIVLEALNLPQVEVGGSWWSKEESRKQSLPVYCVIKSSKQSFTTHSVADQNPLWNCSLTYTFDTIFPSLSFFLFSPSNSWLSANESLGTCKYSLKDTPFDEVIDLNLDIFTNDEKAKSKLHIIVHKIRKSSHGMLKQFGRVMRCIPLRLNFGDIILFNNPEWVRLTIKVATGSEWDHVGMVVKFSDESGGSNFRYFLVEAVNDGVKHFDLEKRLKFYLGCKAQLGIRRLQVARNKKLRIRCERYIKSILGKGYTPIMEIVNVYLESAPSPEETRRLLSPKKDEEKQLRKQWKSRALKDHYFCSEIIAEAYKEMNLLYFTISSERFFPCDFAFPDTPTIENQPLAVVPKLKLRKGKLSGIRIIKPPNVQ
eukprot:TRINITY_DN9804_c0_g1_i1.p1 TRINITY_DN9804_c0_g1~~TRINITY_DN9804_c0_g1_i1.p1  ORF type:complete len:388 (-),score=48.20 TRINITY_DN9804_c0_g1_i1:37-1200(-)